MFFASLFCASSHASLDFVQCLSFAVELERFGRSVTKWDVMRWVIVWNFLFVALRLFAGVCHSGHRRSFGLQSILGLVSLCPLFRDCTRINAIETDPFSVGV